MKTKNLITKSVATSMAAALIVMAPGLDCYRAVAQILPVSPGGASMPVGPAWSLPFQAAFRTIDPARYDMTVDGIHLGSLVSSLKTLDWNSESGRAAARPLVAAIESVGGGPESFSRLSPMDQERLIADAALAEAVRVRRESSALAQEFEQGRLKGPELATANSRLHKLAIAAAWYLPADERAAIEQTKEQVFSRTQEARRSYVKEHMTRAVQGWASGADSVAAVLTDPATGKSYRFAPAQDRVRVEDGVVVVRDWKTGSGAAEAARIGKQGVVSSIVRAARGWWLDRGEPKVRKDRSFARLLVQVMGDMVREEKGLWRGVDAALDTYHENLDRAQAWLKQGRSDQARKDLAWVREQLPAFEGAVKAAKARTVIRSPERSRYYLEYLRRDTDYAVNPHNGDGRYKHEVLVALHGDEAGMKEVRARIAEIESHVQASVAAESADRPLASGVTEPSFLEKPAKLIRPMRTILKTVVSAAGIMAAVAGLVALAHPFAPGPIDAVLGWLAKNILPELKIIGIGAAGAVVTFWVKAHAESFTQKVLAGFEELLPRQKNFIVNMVGVGVMAIAMSKTLNFMGLDWLTIGKGAMLGLGTTVLTLLLTMLTKAPGLINNLPFTDLISGVSMVFSSPVEEGDLVELPIDDKGEKNVRGIVREIGLQRTRVEIEAEDGSKRDALIKNSVITEAKVITRQGGAAQAAPQTPSGKAEPPDRPLSSGVSERGSRRPPVTRELTFTRQAPGRIEGLAEKLAGERGWTQDSMSSAQYVQLMREAGAAFEAQGASQAPSREAFDTAIFVHGQMLRILEAGAGLTKTFRELERHRAVMGGVSAILQGLEEADSLVSAMASAQDIADDAVASLRPRPLASGATERRSPWPAAGMVLLGAAAAVLLGPATGWAAGTVAAGTAGKVLVGSGTGAVAGFAVGARLGWRHGRAGPDNGSEAGAGIGLLVRGGIALVVGLVGGLLLAVAGAVIGSLL